MRSGGGNRNELGVGRAPAAGGVGRSAWGADDGAARGPGGVGMKLSAISWHGGRRAPWVSSYVVRACSEMDMKRKASPAGPGSRWRWMPRCRA
eukprot:4407136-Pleurochrysis_carterae.AAC.1